MNHAKMNSLAIPRRYLAAAALIGSLASSMFSPAPAADFRVFRAGDYGEPARQPQEWGSFSHWDLRELPGCRLPWTMGSSPVPDLDTNGTANQAADRALALATFTAAFGRWEAVTPSLLGFNYVASNVPAGGFVHDNWNTISFGILDRDTFGQTCIFRSANTGRIIEIDMVLNNNPMTMTDGARRKWVMRAHGALLDGDQDSIPTGNFRNPGDGDIDYNGNGIMEYEADAGKTATHEIGHGLGFAHCEPLGQASNDPANAIMDQYTLPIGPRHAGWTNLILKNADRDGMNFLYCPDLGDAPDPCFDDTKGFYPSLVHKTAQGRTLNGIVLDDHYPGAQHILGIKRIQQNRMWTYEWLGQQDADLVNGHGDVDADCEANVTDKDKYDDGVTWTPNPPVWGRYLTVTTHGAYANDNVGNHHSYSQHKLFTNAWLDLNQDCVWDDAGGEHFLDGPMPIRTPLTQGVPNTILHTDTTGMVFLPTNVDPDKPLWLRARLDWGEDVSQAANIDSTLSFSRFAAQFGEVEDYPLWCREKYEQQWLQNRTGIPVQGLAMVFVGVPSVEQTFSAQVTSSDCIVAGGALTTTTYDPTPDETITTFLVPPFIPPSIFWHFGKCKQTPTMPPLTLARTFWVEAGQSMTSPGTMAAVSPSMRVPSVNVGTCALSTLGTFTGLTVTVGALDASTGGWIAMANPLTGAWTDTLNVTVSYRVAPHVVPLAGLSPCDPYYSSLPPIPVGSGRVTPKDGFNFTLAVPTNIQPGQALIVETTTSWRTNLAVNHQLTEFPNPIPVTTAVGDTPVPSRLALENHPNPFNPTTMIRFALPEATVVTLKVYDVQGRLVKTLVSGRHTPVGVHEIEWSGTDNNGMPVSSGVYFYRLTAGSETLTRKAVLLK